MPWHSRRNDPFDDALILRHARQRIQMKAEPRLHKKAASSGFALRWESVMLCAAAYSLSSAPYKSFKAFATSDVFCNLKRRHIVEIRICGEQNRRTNGSRTGMTFAERTTGPNTAHSRFAAGKAFAKERSGDTAFS